jgi:hypothetical protein
LQRRAAAAASRLWFVKVDARIEAQDVDKQDVDNMMARSAGKKTRKKVSPTVFGEVAGNSEKWM